MELILGFMIPTAIGLDGRRRRRDYNSGANFVLSPSPGRPWEPR
jgi:hypothetical protein